MVRSAVGLAFVVALLAGPVRASEKPPLAIEGFSDEAKVVAPEALAPDVIAERWWTHGAGDLTERMAELRLRKPLTPRQWLKRWRASHGCAVKVLKDLPPIAAIEAPQLTFSAVCKGGDRAVVHLVQFEGAIVELHVDTRRLDLPLTRLNDAMRALLSRVRTRDRVP